MRMPFSDKAPLIRSKVALSLHPMAWIWMPSVRELIGAEFFSISTLEMNWSTSYLEDIYDSGAEVHDSIQLISELLRAVFAGDDTHKWEIGSAVRSVHDISSGSGQYIQA